MERPRRTASWSLPSGDQGTRAVGQLAHLSEDLFHSAVVRDPLAVEVQLVFGEHEPDGLPTDFARPVVVRAMPVPRRLMTMTRGLAALKAPGLDAALADKPHGLQFRL